MLPDTFQEWTWVESEHAWLKGHYLNGMGVFKDFETDTLWRYNLVVDGDIVVMGEGNFEKVEDAKAAAEKDFAERKVKSL